MKLKARHKLTLDNAPLVMAIATEIVRGLPRHIDRRDLFGAGMLALFQATKIFDGSRGIGFGQFAKHRVRGAILDYLRTEDHLTRDQRRLRRRFEHFADSLGRRPTPEEFAGEVGVAAGRIRNNLSIIADAPTSLEFSVGNHFRKAGSRHLKERRLRDVVASAQESQDARVQRKDQEEQLRRAMEDLPGRYAHVIKLYYFDGLRDCEIGRRMGFNESRSCQIRHAALGKIRRHLSERGLSFSSLATG